MNLPITECLSYGWRTFKARPWFFAGAFFLATIVSWLAGLPGRSTSTDAFHSATGFMWYAVTFLLSLVVSTLVQMGEYHFSFRAHDDAARATLRDLLYVKPFWSYVGLSILTVIILVPAFILLVVPGVILSLMFSLAPLVVIERGLGPIDALKESVRLTKGNRVRLLGLFLLVVLINILGLLALVIGLFVTIPVTTFAFVHAYRLLAQGDEPATPVPAMGPEGAVA